MKRLLFFLILAGLAMGRPCVAEDNQRSSDAAKHYSEQQNGIVPPGPKIASPALAQPCSKDSPCYTEDAAPEKLLPRWQRPEWVIVYVTVVYSVLTAMMWHKIKGQAETMERQADDFRKSSVESSAMAQATLEAIKRQGDLMERQTELTEASMRQWVELADWQNVIDWNETSTGHRLQISFQIINPTSFLLTTEVGQINFENPKQSVLFIYRPAPLGPERPLTINFWIPLREGPAKSYLAGQTIGFGVSGFITYVTAREQRVTQAFNGLISCDLKETTFEASIGHVEPA